MALTPMMIQYLETKKTYKEDILFFRLGDFYEMFYDDAITCSRELELTLTGKDCGLEERAPMCGIPYHAAEGYIAKLIAKGYKVAICEQTEDPALAKGIVKREVIRIVTPGTVLETNMLDDKKNNYIASIFKSKEIIALAYADISTGEFYVTEMSNTLDGSNVVDEIYKISPSELVIKGNMLKETKFLNNIKKISNIYITDYDKFEKLTYNIDFLLPTNTEKRAACIMLLNYINETQKTNINHINKIENFMSNKYMTLDLSTRRNLELLEGNREKTKKGSLLWVLDKTSTSMGGRNIRKWIESPLIDTLEINERLEAVECLKNNVISLGDIEETLKSVYDIERIISKVVCGNINARDLIMLKNSIVNLPNIKEAIGKIKNESAMINNIYENFDLLQDIYDLLDKAIEEDAPISLKEGGLIKKGYDAEIDELKIASTEGKNWILDIEQKEKELTGIKNLKVGYNKIFGYYIEATRSNLSQIPEDRYIRKQTLAGCERYVTQELKEIEDKVLGSFEKLVNKEYKIFCEIRCIIANQVIRVQNVSRNVAVLDTLCSFATVSIDNSYIRPIVDNSGIIDIKDGRHAVVEKTLKEELFIPNDTYLDKEDDRFSIITGPNMAGKSTYMRQVAIIVLMSQIGCFVPASNAKIGVVDRIFTRVGASDDLAMGQSTFMVEMAELANILEKATSNSLIVLDEIGRGTSTYDGLAIAWATVEYVANKNKIGAKTLFATHYHELTELEGKIEGVKNYSIEVKEKGDDVIFLRKIIRGGTDESYGVYVAKLAGVPAEVVKFAKSRLKELEIVDITKRAEEARSNKGKAVEDMQFDVFNYNMTEIAKILEKTKLDELSPKDALDVLYRLKEKMM